MKAIETTYKGYRFRSRLEARWAVFFDALELHWEYEKEGYDLGDAGWYLPDFWLPDVGKSGLWFEVKGVAPTEEELRKACRLRAASPDSMVVVCMGTVGLPMVEIGLDNRWTIKDGALMLVVNRVTHGGLMPDGKMVEEGDFVIGWGMGAWSEAAMDGSIEPWTFYPYVMPGLSLFDEDPLIGAAFSQIEKAGGTATMSLLADGQATLGYYIGTGRIFDSPRLLSAYKAARSARFEHGERGAP